MANSIAIRRLLTYFLIIFFEKRIIFSKHLWQEQPFNAVEKSKKWSLFNSDGKSEFHQFFDRKSMNFGGRGDLSTNCSWSGNLLWFSLSGAMTARPFSKWEIRWKSINFWSIFEYFFLKNTLFFLNTCDKENPLTISKPLEINRAASAGSLAIQQSTA